MRRVIDLSYAIVDHFRWGVDRTLAASFENGDGFQVTRLGFGVHGFTHIDSPRHILPDGPTTSSFNMNAFVGTGAIIDVSDIEDNAAISAQTLELAGAHLEPDDIVIIKTAWDERYSLEEREFWTEAPYLTRDACEWIVEKRPALVGYDFPQDRPIRDLLRGESKPLEEFVSHDVILRRGIPMIEYLCNLAAVSSARPEICALPMKVLNADGAPARVVAMEN